jgi:hypothetical protein
MREQNWNRLQNEGGEGYNPYVETKNAPDRREKMDRLLSIMSATSSSDPRYDELKKEYNALFAEEWTPEITKARRSEWNEFVMSLKKAGKSVSKGDINKKTAEMGITLADLKKAVEINKL